MTYVEDALSGIIIVLPDGDLLARERVLAPQRPAARLPKERKSGRVAIARLFARKSIRRVHCAKRNARLPLAPQERRAFRFAQCTLRYRPYSPQICVKMPA
ncbi:MAG: hypothetical protein ACKVS5_00540 [Parvularculaceae bacterium]